MPAQRILNVEVGQRFGRGVVVEAEAVVVTAGKNRRAVWLQCDCDGRKYAAAVFDLVYGRRVSCGCVQRENGHNLGVATAEWRRAAARERVRSGRKRCSHCGQVKDLDGGFSRSARKLDGYQDYCRDCDARAHREAYPVLKERRRRAAAEREAAKRAAVAWRYGPPPERPADLLCCGAQGEHERSCPTLVRPRPQRVVTALSAPYSVAVCVRCHMPSQVPLCDRCWAAAGHDQALGGGSEYALKSACGRRSGSLAAMVDAV